MLVLPLLDGFDLQLRLHADHGSDSVLSVGKALRPWGTVTAREWLSRFGHPGQVHVAAKETVNQLRDAPFTAWDESFQDRGCGPRGGATG